MQNVDAQSAPAWQPLPSAHFVAQVPPQSTAVSWPFCSPSSHCVATHTCDVPLQNVDAQSVPFAQPNPSAHFVAQVPPQSAPVSWPFFSPSSHCVGTHKWVCTWQKVDAQSAPV